MRRFGTGGIRGGLGAVGALSMLLWLGGCEMESFGGYTAEGYFGATPETKLAVAAGRGDVKAVRRLVRAGADVNRAGEQNFTPLGWALSQRNVAGMRALLEAGADPNQRIGPKYELHLVWLAAAMEPSSILEVLLQFKGDPNATHDGPDYVALARTNSYNLSQASRLRNVKLLVEAGADINVTAEFGTPYLVDAAGHTWYDVVLYALDHGYNQDLPLLAYSVHLRRPEGKAPLPDHVERERLLVVEKLRQMGVVTPEKPPPPRPPRRPPGLATAPVAP